MSPLEPYKRAFSKDEINTLPLNKYSGTVHIIYNKNQLNSALRAIKKETILGFDTETRPTFKKGQCRPPALLQLATSQCAYLFRLNQMPLSKSVCDVLTNPDIIKTGIAVRDDIRELKQLRDFQEAGFIDLGEVARKHGLQTSGLRTLAANLLGFRISKTAQCSNWEARVLDKRQVTYAATDAWVSRELYLRMQGLNML